MDNKFKNSDFARDVGLKAERKLKARKHPDQSIWFGLGMTGLIGWSVITPTLLGTILGAWMDKHHPGGHSWTLSLLIAGLLLGCLNAWHWMTKEADALKEEDHE